MTKGSSSAASSLGPGIPTRRRSNSSAAAAEKAAASSSNGAAASTRSNSLAANRPKRRSRGLPLTRSASAPAPAPAPTPRKRQQQQQQQQQDDDGNDSDNTHHSGSTASSHTEEPPPTKTSSSNKKSSSNSASSTPNASGNTKGGRSSLQTPPSKSGSSSGKNASASSKNASASSKNASTLIASMKQGKNLKVQILVDGKIFSPTSSVGSASSVSSSTPSVTKTGSTRKRTRTSSVSSGSGGGGATTTTTTTTITKNNEVLVETISSPPTTPNNSKATKKITGSETPLGHDGNLFHCFVCGEFGDVVCCDGCPNVYHQRCIDKEDPSRIALDNDEDPWFCPSCRSKNNNNESATTKKTQRGGSKNKKKGGSTSNAPASSPKLRSGGNSGGDKGSSKTCCECGRSTGILEQCERCQTWLHYPSCKEQRAANSKSKNDGDVSILCFTCQELASDEDAAANRAEVTSGVTPDRNASSDSKASSAKKKKKRKRGSTADTTKKEDASLDTSMRRRTRSATSGDGHDDDDDASSMSNMDQVSVAAGSTKSSDPDDDDGAGDDDTNAPDDDDAKSEGEPSKKRQKSGGASSPTPSQSDNASVTTADKKGKKNAKKKKKKKKKQDDDEQEQQQEQQQDATDDGSVRPIYGPGSSMSMAKATPAFYFFLAENRLKIERNLSRKHKYFNRLPKGYDRNELVAKEGASWWVKLRPSEIRRYMNISMRDFEQRIIEWKEEKNIREMLMETDIDGEDGEVELSAEDDILTQQNHERLYLGTTVGSKPFKPEPDESHNRVLLELLQDMRFHPVPMFIANRTETEYGQMDFARITIPYFDVHGPVSTSVGDECLGCTRGWTHHCNVLKRRIPAVEHRAKLQPPLSSLIATRVGLGLRPRPQAELTEEKDGEDGEIGNHVSLFAKREVPEVKEAKNLPWVPWDSLKDSSNRADDIVQFVEEAVSMKVPEPPRPGVAKPQTEKDVSKKTMMPRALLPTRGRKRPSLDSLDSGDDGIAVVNKCGRCRTVIQTDTGCIQCRRAQLVINMSKRPGRDEGNGKTPAKGGGGGGVASGDTEAKGSKLLKVQTYMLGRINMKEGSGEIQSDGDQAIANGILRQRWTPFVVLPPHTIDAPTPQPKRSREEGEDETADDDDSSKVSNDKASSTENSKQPAKVDGKAENDDASDGSNTRGASKRIRSARIVAQTASADPLDDADRQLLAQRYKEEADELQKKCLSVACCGILLALMRRDPLLLFAAPVTAEGYASIIKNPIDFEKIRSNVLSGKYGTLGSFVSDARLLCTNALAYNPPGSIYWKTAKELYDVLAVMQKRASNWMGAIKDAHAFAWRRAPKTKLGAGATDDEPQQSPDEFFIEDPFESLRKKWPEAVEMLENSDWLRKCIKADFMRTKENETAYYGSLAARRAAVAAEASLAPYPDTSGVFSPVSQRNHIEDENLRKFVDERVADIIDPVELKDLPTWREESIVRVMRRAQSRRLEGLIGSVNGCARCDGMRVDQELKMAMTAEAVRWGRTRRKNHEVSRVHPSRVDLSTGLASQNTMNRINKDDEKRKKAKADAARGGASYASPKDVDSKLADNGSIAPSVAPTEAPPDVAVSVRGSRVHGWGLFADQPFRVGDVVAEYVGEYVSLAVTEAREKIYQEQRIQDYQFRLDDQLVIDATMRGGHGRYINHNCSPNCIAKIISGTPPNEHLKRVIIIAQRDIEPREELTYDYQFPLELDLDARIPCNCHSEHCRGFMNWDLPEKGANNRVFRAQKRGANMRDRIRRLGRPLKSEK